MVVMAERLGFHVNLASTNPIEERRKEMKEQMFRICVVRRKVLDDLHIVDSAKSAFSAANFVPNL